MGARSSGGTRGGRGGFKKLATVTPSSSARGGYYVNYTIPTLGGGSEVRHQYYKTAAGAKKFYDKLLKAGYK